MPDVFDFELIGDSSIPADLLEQSKVSASAIGYAHGWAQGLRDARQSMADESELARLQVRAASEQYQAELKSALLSVSQAADQVALVGQLTDEANEHAILNSALQIAEALIGRELRDADQATLTAISRVLRPAPAAQPVTIRINADVHTKMMTAEFRSILTSVIETSGREIRFEPDSTLSPADAIAFCAGSTIDGRLSAGIQRLRNHLASEAGAAPEAE